MTTLVWFRQDLRLRDNPALYHAALRGEPVIPVYIWAPHEEGDWAPGAASRVWLHCSLERLIASLHKKHSSLVIRQGDSLERLQQLIQETGATAVYWNRRYEPQSIERDTKVKTALRDQGVEANSFNASLLFEPWQIETKQGGCYKVFTPYWKAMLNRPEAEAPLDAPSPLPTPNELPRSDDLISLGLLPAIRWDQGIRDSWQPGEQGAHTQLGHFMKNHLGHYEEKRNLPSQPATSKMSPHLHFGEISPRQIWHAVRNDERMNHSEWRQAAWAYLRELGWREFGYHLIYHFPHTPDNPLNERFAHFPWRDDDQQLRAWQKGQTGYPIVDAGMRELWHTGWMHNRVRMIVASFLVKDLMLPWQQGEQWFWDTLVDADLANNTLGWQWAAGCGADAAPYFRIFNPTLQGERFDKEGDYVRRWVPELAGLPKKWIHKPHEAPQSVLDEAGIRLGETYPFPIVDHKRARNQALEAFEQVKSQ
mgnify:CR=1 FL=1